MELFKIAACALCAVIFAVLLKKSNPEYALLISVLAAVSICFITIQAAAPFFNELEQIASGEMGEYLTVLFKAVGVTMLGQAVSNMCKDAGEGALAYAVILTAKTEILLLSMPMLAHLFDFLGEILGI